MRSTHPDAQEGPRPWWNGVGFGLAVAFMVAFMVVMYAPAAPVPEEGPVPTSAPAHTITLDELEAMLTDSEEPGPPPTTVQVQTPDGPVTVVIPATTTTSTTSTTSTTTTTQPPSEPTPPRDPGDVMDDMLDDILGPPTTTAEGAGG